MWRKLHVGRVADWPGPPAEDLVAAARSGRQVFETPDGAIVHAWPGTFSQIADDWHELSLEELQQRASGA